jgi:hypothetical protein
MIQHEEGVGKIRIILAENTIDADSGTIGNPMWFSYAFYW